jgi:hypothetical protein
MTSGLYKTLKGKGIEDILPLMVTDKKATTDTFKSNAFGLNNGVFEKALGNVTVPHLSYHNNDVWMLSAAMTSHYSHPILLCGTYDKGKLFVLTIPDSPDDLYKLPSEVLTRLRIELDLPITLECSAGIGLFTYDNDIFILQSFIDRPERVRIHLKKPGASVDLLQDMSMRGRFSPLKHISDSLYEVFLQPGRYIALRIEE